MTIWMTSHPGPGNGEGRRALWELDSSDQASLLGACLPSSELRQTMDRVFGGRSSLDDYDLYKAVVAQCGTRNKVTIAVHRVLERRFASTVRAFHQARSAEALAILWKDAVQAGQCAGAVWATFTHSLCDALLRERITRDLVMLQHAALAGAGAESAKYSALATENQILARALARAQQRHSDWHVARQAERQQVQAELVRMRAVAAAKDHTIATLRQGLDVQAPPPDGDTRVQLRRRVTELVDQLSIMQRALEAQRSDNTRLCDAKTRGNHAHLSPVPEVRDPRQAGRDAERVSPRLHSTSVLCVGGRSGQIPGYRALVERHGGHFAHHDGGVQDSPHRLNAHLAAADLVICQAGCLSHNAYWRVKDHCKRTGKQCVYLEKPGLGSFLRGLEQVAGPSPDIASPV